MNLLDEINKIVPDAVKVQIKDLQAKFNSIPATVVPAPAPVVAPVVLEAVETKLKDGSVLMADKLEVGGKAEIVMPDGTKSEANGEYEAEDGTVIVCQAGIISEVRKPEGAAPVAPEMPEMMKALEQRLAAIEAKFSETKTENEGLKNELKEANEAIKVTLSAVNSILSTPAGKPIEKPNTLIDKKNSSMQRVGDLLNKNK